MAMEDSSMMPPADIAALTRGNTGFGGDGISWLVLILLFFGFMGGGWGGRYGNGELVHSGILCINSKLHSAELAQLSQAGCRCHHKAQSRKGRNGKAGGMGTSD